MKKKLFYYLFTVICSVTLFASCSDDDEKVVNPVPQTTFTGENGLQLTYNGAPMLGKKVTFTPDATNAQKATLRLEGEFDLNGILGKAKSAAAREEVSMPTAPGVLPGSPVVTLPVDLTINGDQCSFAGTSETDYLQKEYPELAIDGEMQVNFALNTKLRDEKYPFTRLKGKEVNTLVFPNLSSANATYQLIQSMSETEVIGPIQMGLNKPIHFTDCEASVRDIVNITAVAVIDAIVDKKKKEK